MKRKNILLALLLTGTLATGCMKENYSFCPEGVYVTFEAANPKHDYADLVQNLSLYLYDPESGALIGSWDYTRDQLRAGDRAALMPYSAPGTYRLLAVVNDGLYTTTYGPDLFSTIHSTVDGEVLAYDAEAFFSSERTITIGVTPATRAATEVEEHQMVLAKHNNNLYLHLEYDDYVPTESTNLTAWIDSPNRAFHYRPYNAGTGQMLRSDFWARTDNYDRDTEHRYPYHPAEMSFSTMRMWHGGNMVLYIQEEPETGAVAEEFRRLTIDVTGALKEYVEPGTTEQRIYDTDAELEFHDEYHITVRLSELENPVIVGNQKQMVVMVRKWEYVKGSIIL